MNFKVKVAIVALVMAAVAASPQSRESAGPVFGQNGDLALPTGYRAWIFIGGPITPNGLNKGGAPFPSSTAFISNDRIYATTRRTVNFPKEP